MIGAIDNDKPLPKLSITEEKDCDSDDPYFTMKHSIQQLQRRDETFIPGNVSCDDCCTNVRADESDKKEKEEREEKQEVDVSFMEISSASQIREALNSLFNFALITGNKESSILR